MPNHEAKAWRKVAALISDEVFPRMAIRRVCMRSPLSDAVMIDRWLWHCAARDLTVTREGSTPLSESLAALWCALEVTEEQSNAGGADA